MERDKIRFIFEKDHVNGALVPNYEMFLVLNHLRKKVMVAAEAVMQVESALDLATKKSSSRGSGQIKAERCGTSDTLATSTEELVVILETLLFTRKRAFEQALSEFNSIDVTSMESYDVYALVNEIGDEQHDASLL